MSEPNGLHDRISRVFSDALNLDVPAVDTDLFDTGVLDSLGFVNLLLHLEREFGVTTSIDDLEIDNFRSIARIAEFVVARAAVAPGTGQ
jgi:D-alanine--poly(phosphoribitol) ligase subunit 2